MNKILNSMKNSLLILNFIFILCWIKQNGIGNLHFVMYMIGFFVLSFITIKDIRNQMRPSERYNILFIVVELLVNFLFLRAFYDPSFICNSLNYKELIQTPTYDDICVQFRVNYFNQNSIYLFILYITLYMFHKLEYPQVLYRPSKYSKASILLCLINILTIPTIFKYLESYSIHFLNPFFFLEIGLVVAEIITLILYNHKKKDYPIYICFLFNLFAFISIFV